MQQDSENERLLERGVSAATWSSVGAVVRIGLQLGAQVLLARLLGPEPYGLFAIAFTLVLLVSLFSDFGLSYGLIQRPTATDHDVRFVFTWQMLLGLAMALLLAAAASPISRLFGDMRLEPVVQALGLSCIIAASGSTANMLLRRRLDFRSVNIALVASYAIGYLGVGLTLALLEAGVWALVAATLTQLALAAVMHLRAAPHAMAPLFVHPDWRSMLGFGSTVLATNLLNWLLASLDRLVVGLTMPIAAAGLYATIGNLVLAPMATFNGVLQSALYATSARAQDNPARLRRALPTVLAIVMLLFAPVFAAISMTAGTQVAVIFGTKWIGGDVVLRPLALAVPAMMLMGMAVPTLWASGRTTWEFTLQVPLAVIWALALVPIAATGSLETLSWCVCAWFHVRAAVIIMAATRLVAAPLRELLAPLRAGVIVTLAVAATAALADAFGPQTLLLREALIVALCAAVMLLTMLLVRPLLSGPVRHLIAILADRIPHDGMRAAIHHQMQKPS